MVFSRLKKRRTVRPERILIACVAENREPYTTEILYLFRSLAAFGGSLACSQQIAYFVEAADAEIVEQLSSLGVIVKIVPRLNERYPHANKIQMLDQQEDYDLLIGLDCDVVITKDFSPLLEPDAFMAKPVDKDHLTIDQWCTIFQWFNLSLPNERYLTTFDAKETIPYFNSGVISIPKQFVHALSNAWKMFALAMQDLYDHIPEIAAHSFFTDQFALTLALSNEKIPLKVLPLEMNFPIHAPIHTIFHPEKSNPYILHHHHRIFKTGLADSTYKNINLVIEKINSTLCHPILTNLTNGLLNSVQTDFDNLHFWEERYRTNLDLGSGVGSRGENLTYKKRILKKLIQDTPPASLLDVGCGDLEVIGDFSLKNYLGIDVSDFITKRNTRLRPNWSFRAEDFLKIVSEEQLSADMVMCLDVLIHEHDPKRYERMVEALVKATKEIGVVSAYELPPRARFSSSITAYHEPITHTLRRTGAYEIQVIGYYRDVSIIRYRSNKRIGNK